MSLHEVARDGMLGCWVVWAVVWIANWMRVKRTVEQQSWLSRLGLIGGLMVAAVVALVVIGPERMNAKLFEPSLWTDGGGAVMCVAGLGVTLWARWTLGRNWSAMVTLKEDHELVERGPYRLVRHPIYSGVLLMLVGTVGVVGRVNPLVWLVLAAFLFKMREEEKLMRRHFGERYVAYKRRVKALVPFVV